MEILSFMRNKEKYGVYTIRCKIDGKLLVGEGEVNKRLSRHKWLLRNNQHPNNHLQSAYNKYGELEFEFELLMNCEAEFTKSFENYWCNLLNTHNRNYGYNKKKTNPYQVGGHSEETRRKMSLKNMGRPSPKKGIPMSEETKEKLRIQAIGRIITPETRKKIANSRKGKCSDAQKEKMRIMQANNIGRVHSEEVRRKVSDAKKGMKFTESHKNNLKKALINNPKKSKIIIQMTKEGEIIAEYPSVMEASRQLNKNSGSIGNVLNGKHKTTGGYKFIYKAKE